MNNAMKKDGIKLQVIWEEVVTTDAEQRLAAAFAMLLSPLSEDVFSKQGLDSKD